MAKSVKHDDTGLTCRACGSPWFEPRFGTLWCCDCDIEYGKDE